MSSFVPRFMIDLWNSVPAPLQEVTIAETLRQHGYRTAHLGKWHLGGTGKPEWSPKIERA